MVTRKDSRRDGGEASYDGAPDRTTTPPEAGTQRRARPTELMLVCQRDIASLGLRVILSKTPACRIVADMPQDHETVSTAAQLQPPIIVFGLVKADENEIEVLRELREACEASKIIVFYYDVDRAACHALARIRVDACISWFQVDGTNFVGFPKATAKGLFVASPNFMELLCDEDLVPEMDGATLLKARIRLIIKRYEEGCTASEIAAEVGEDVTAIERALAALKEGIENRSPDKLDG